MWPLEAIVQLSHHNAWANWTLAEKKWTKKNNNGAEMKFENVPSEGAAACVCVCAHFHRIKLPLIGRQSGCTCGHSFFNEFASSAIHIFVLLYCFNYVWKFSVIAYSRSLASIAGVGKHIMKTVFTNSLAFFFGSSFFQPDKMLQVPM